MTIYFSRFADVMVSVHQHALRPALLVYTWLYDDAGWNQCPPIEVEVLAEAQAAVAPDAVPVPIPGAVGLGAWRGAL